MAGLSWAIWLAVPVVVTLLAALLFWWRGRPDRPLRTAETISGHRAYLDALEPAVASPKPTVEITSSEILNPPG